MRHPAPVTGLDGFPSATERCVSCHNLTGTNGARRVTSGGIACARCAADHAPRGLAAAIPAEARA